MFTGIITDIGEILETSGSTERQFKIGCSYEAETIDLGASIACNGCCLTVTDKDAIPGGSWFDVTVSSESLAKTNLGGWKEGTFINLERSLKHGDELGGHMVSGHVDAVALLLSQSEDGDSIKFEFEAPDHLLKYIAPKGSIALNGTSLTVNHVNGAVFDIMMIPHTLTHTIWGKTQETFPGAHINLEIDMLARYAEKLAQNMKETT